MKSRLPVTTPTKAERQEYVRQLRFAMTLACVFFALPIWASLREGHFIMAVLWWAVAEMHFWLCSVEPTKQWLAEHRKAVQ